MKHRVNTSRLGTEKAGNLCFVYLFIFTANIISHAFLLINFSKSRQNMQYLPAKAYVKQYGSHTVCHPWGSFFLFLFFILSH